jgi:CubicO group peptidase (beta-lactamase class C family)
MPDGFQEEKMRKRILVMNLALVCVVVVTASACGEAQAGNRPEGSSLEARIEGVENGLVKFTPVGPMPFGRKHSLTDRMAHYQVPGVSIVVIDDYKIDWAKGYGVRMAGGDEPVTTDMLFNAGSIVKMFSAAGAMKLVEAGILDLDQNVNDVLVSWQVPENEFTATEKVTLRRLLSHSAGIRDGFTNRSGSDIDALPDYLAPGGESPSVTIQEMLEGAPGVDLDGPTTVGSIPGSEYNYANADYAILELLLVDVTGKPYPEFMMETVLEPLDLESSTFEVPLPEDLRAKAAWEHFADGAPFEGERLHFPFGSLWTNPSDLARFAIEIMQAYNGRSEVLLSQGFAKEMLTAQIDIEGNMLEDAYGFGFDLQTNKDELVAFHTGGTWGSTCIVWIFPQTGQGAVVMTNSASGSMIRFEILYSISQVYGWP